MIACLPPPPIASKVPPPPLAPPPPPPPPGLLASPLVSTSKRWEEYPANSERPLPIELSEDAIRAVLFHVTRIDTLQKCKRVCKSWKLCAREVLCGAEWHVANGLTLHTLLKSGQPSARLAMGLSTARPPLLQERDDEGLLPLQWASAYKRYRGLDEALVDALRAATRGSVPGGLPAMDRAAFSRKLATLRPVQPVVRLAPIAA